MLEIRNIDVYGLERSIIASGYAMTTKPYDYEKENWTNFEEKHFPRAKRLVQASKKGEIKCHDNFLTGILVSFDIKYPQYISPELQRYHFMQIVTSQSKMHRLLKMDISNSCNKYVSKRAIDNLKDAIEYYNEVEKLKDEEISASVKLASGEIVTFNSKKDLLYFAWMRCVSDCPMGLELWMRVTTNYKQLQTIYRQRKNHKLKEDWGAFCRFVESLPYASELILGEE